MEEIIITVPVAVFSFPSMFFEQMNDIESVVRGFTKMGMVLFYFSPLLFGSRVEEFAHV